MQYHKKVFEKHGVKVTDDNFPMKYATVEKDAVTDAYILVKSGRTKGKRLIRELKKLQEQYPDIPEIYNYLAAAYLSQNKNKEANKVIKETIRRFPDYIFGKLQWAELSLNQNNPKEVPKVLGAYTDINHFADKNGFIHYTFYLPFFILQGRYFLAMDDIDKAKECLGRMLAYDKQAIQTKILAKEILQKNLENIKNPFEKFCKFDKYRIEVEDKATYTPLQVDIKPTFFHPEIELFYQKSLDELTVKEIEKIINLPKDSLVKDLELVVEDAIVRYKWFSNHYLEYNDSEQNAVNHALNFLCGLKSEQSLQKVLNLLRQKDEFLDYWFNDVDSYFSNYLFSVSKNSLKEFQSFIYESYVNYRGKYAVIEAISQCYFHYPEIKEDFLSILKEISDFFLETKDKSVFDTNIPTALIGVYLDHNLTDFIPYVQQFFKNNWIDEMVYGNEETVIENIKFDDATLQKEAFPYDVFEDYSGVYFKRKKKPEPVSFVNKAKDKAKDKDKDDVDNFLMNMIFNRLPDEPSNHEYNRENDDYYENSHRGTYKREHAKVGRNEPCPCGSEKKYKKCCINK